MSGSDGQNGGNLRLAAATAPAVCGSSATDIYSSHRGHQCREDQIMMNDHIQLQHTQSRTTLSFAVNPHLRISEGYCTQSVCVCVYVCPPFFLSSR